MSPTRPLYACTVPMCPNRSVKPGRCAVHQQQRRQQSDSERGTSSERGYDAEWRRVRARHLHDYPWCVMCEAKGVMTEATEVDHVLELAKGGTHAKENLRSMCHSHHSQRTARESGGFGNRRPSVKLW